MLAFAVTGLLLFGVYSRINNTRLKSDIAGRVGHSVIAPPCAMLLSENVSVDGFTEYSDGLIFSQTIENILRYGWANLGLEIIRLSGQQKSGSRAHVWCNKRIKIRVISDFEQADIQSRAHSFGWSFPEIVHRYDDFKRPISFENI